MTDDFDESFENFLNEQFHEEIITHNICQECNIPMEFNISEYLCTECGNIIQYTAAAGNIDHGGAVGNVIRKCTGGSKGAFYNHTVDYTKQQYKLIIDQLMSCYNEWKGIHFPINILTAVASQYNHVQKTVTIKVEDTVKKFVQRGVIKDETLAAFLYQICLKEGIARKKRDIAAFMKLPTGGFPRGESILYSLMITGKIELVIYDEDLLVICERYMESLKMTDKNYLGFVMDVVIMSEDFHICTSSQMSSKAAGAFWIIVTQKCLNISSDEMERITDKTKKHTFLKFYKAVFENIDLFRKVFNKYGIPTYIL